MNGLFSLCYTAGMHADLMRVIRRIFVEENLPTLRHSLQSCSNRHCSARRWATFASSSSHVWFTFNGSQKKDEKKEREREREIDDMFPVTRVFNLSKAHSTQLLLLKRRRRFDTTRHSTRKRVNLYHDLHVGSLRLGTRLSPRLSTRSHNRPQCIVRF